MTDQNLTMRPAAAGQASNAQIPSCLLADDATATDQLALSVFEALGCKVVTMAAASFAQAELPPESRCVRIINTGTRALSPREANVRNQRLASHLLSEATPIPVVQIDSRLRGVGNALKGICDSLDFDLLLFVPAEPELGRLVQAGIYYHLEDGRRTPFHESALVRSVERPFTNSALREFIATELGIPQTKVFSLGGEIVARGPDAVVANIRGLKPAGKCVVVPDIGKPEDVGSVIGAIRTLRADRILLAASRTFLRDFFASFQDRRTGTPPASLLSQHIDRTKRGAPLAVVCSLEPAMGSQIEFASRALGPHLVTIVFDASAILADDQAIRQEVDRVQGLLLRSLRAMRPVLLRSSGARFPNDPGIQQRLLDAVGQVMALAELPRHVTALFIAGGQTAETLRTALHISAVEIKGRFQESIPWGLPLDGSFQSIPTVTKGGRLGREELLFEFFEQGHPLPRANVLPVVTPLTKSKEIDEPAIRNLIHHLVRLGTTDIFAVGNAGEFRFLANENRLRALEVFAREARGKLRVFAGVTGDSPEETIHNYEAAGRLGVFAAVIMPLYFLKSSEEIVPFVNRLGAIGSGLPLVLYNNPERTRGQNISFDAVEALPFPAVALKDSSGDLDRFDRYVGVLPVYQGQQRQFFEGYQHGARGSVGIIGHISPLPNEFYAPASTAARREEIGRGINDLSKQAKQGGAEVAAYKYLLSLMGVMGDTVASNEPARELTPAQREQIRARNTDLIRLPGSGAA
jgi:4-hydroxy-tetrahydrodipicolinate synthase